MHKNKTNPHVWLQHDNSWCLFPSSDSLLYVAAGELGSLLLHGEVQPRRQRPPARLAEETHPVRARGESVKQYLYYTALEDGPHVKYVLL